MLIAKGKINKVAVLRPGALGDVLAVRSVIRFVKDAFPGVEVVLAAPGARGAFLRREGWADRVCDWDRAAFAWLFSDGGREPPAALRAVFAGCDWILSYVDPEQDMGWERLETRLNALAPAAGKVFCPSKPEPGHGEAIGSWLARAAVAFCQRYRLLSSGELPDPERLAAARVRVEGGADSLPFGGDRYAVIHPGSGSARKNWPLENFAGIGLRLMEKAGLKLVVTSGEADGELGGRLAAMLPGAAAVHRPELEALAGILANARLYVGNDSGVSHLAAAVENAAGGHPRAAVIFGPSDASVWAPPEAFVLHAGVGMDGLSVDDAWKVIGDLLPENA